MYRTYSEWAKKAWDPAEWMRMCWDPTEWMRLGADCMSYGVWTGQRFYGRKAEAEELERLKTRLQEEISEIDKRLEELKAEDSKH